MVAAVQQDKARARQALDTGRHRDAARLLEGVLERAPEEWPVVLQLGDLYTRLGRKGPANAQYRRLADHYEEEGHHARAAALWQKILRNDATFLGAHLKLGGLYGELGKRVEARRHYETVLEEYRKRGREREAEMVEINLADLEGRPSRIPASPAPAPPAWAEGPDESGSPHGHSEGGPTETAPDPTLGSAGEAEFLEERLLQGRLFRRYGLLTQARCELELVLERAPDNVEAREELREVLREQGEHEGAAAQQQQLDALKTGPATGPVVEAPTTEIPEAGADQAGPSASPDEISGVGDLAGLEAVLVDEPPEIPPEQLVPLELTLLPGPEEVESDDPPPSGTVVAEEPERQSPAQLATMVEDFRRGVDEQVEGDDFETRYNLAIAYRGMGLLDEAVGEFQRAAKDPARLFDCAGLLAQCFVEKGLPQLAVSWVERGLKVEGRTEEEYQELRYELAKALEASGESERALGIYVELYGENARLRDVAEKVRQLAPAPAKTGTAGAASDAGTGNVLPWKRG